MCIYLFTLFLFSQLSHSVCVFISEGFFSFRMRASFFFYRKAICKTARPECALNGRIEWNEKLLLIHFVIRCFFFFICVYRCRGSRHECLFDRMSMALLFYSSLNSIPFSSIFNSIFVLRSLFFRGKTPEYHNKIIPARED